MLRRPHRFMIAANMSRYLTVRLPRRFRMLQRPLNSKLNIFPRPSQPMRRVGRAGEPDSIGQAALMDGAINLRKPQAAVLIDVEMPNAKLCNTTMPDGTVNNRDCSPETPPSNPSKPKRDAAGSKLTSAGAMRAAGAQKKRKRRQSNIWRSQ
jgi:hypothetical protein